MSKNCTRGHGIALLTLFLINLMFINLNFTPTTVNLDDPAAEQSPETIDGLSSAAFEKVDSWWNETFQYRIEVKITEPGYADRENEPVSVYLTFAENTHSWNSTRVVEYTGNWNEIPSQVWNITLHDTYYITSCTTTFMVNALQGETKVYFIYYTNEFIDNKTAQYYQDTKFSALFNGQSVQIDNDQIRVQFANQSGYNLLALKEDSFTINYDKPLSLAPSSSVVPHYPDFYTTDAYGNIRNWLVIGAFKENNYPSWTGTDVTNFSSMQPLGSDYRNFVDITKSYVEGDKASGATVGPAYIDYTKSWSIFPQTNPPNLVDAIDLNAYFGGGAGGDPPNDVSAYCLTYVFSPVELPVCYLKYACDDGFRVYLNGEPPSDSDYHFHGLRGIGTTDFRSVTVSLKKGWNRLLIICMERGGNWRFRVRFSTIDSTGANWNDPTGAITNLKIAYAPLSFIDAESSPIEEVQSGPVFAQYTYKWANSQDMAISDTVTFYQSLNLFKVDRKFYWTADHNPLASRNNSFSVFNGFYNNSQCDQYIFDGQTQPDPLSQGLANTNFEASNYVVARDYNNNQKLAVGTFVTNFTIGSDLMTLTYLKWKVTYDGTTIGMSPGNWTDLDNNPFQYPAESNRYVNVTFWEFIKKNVGSGQEAASEVDKYYQCLMHPVILESYPSDVESCFFNLDVTVKDFDGAFASGVNVTLVNATDNATGWNFLWNQPQANQSQLTDGNGFTRFVRLKAANYTVNLTYAAYGYNPVPISQFLWGQTNVTLNTTKPLEILNVSLTHLSLNFLQWDPADGLIKGPISGGNVTFYTNRSSDLTLIGNIVTTTTGFADFYWVRYAQADANVTFKLNFLATDRIINITVGRPENNITVPMENATSYDVCVQIGQFSTRADLHPSSLYTDRFWGESVVIAVNYSYSVGVSGEWNPIEGALVQYTLASTRRGTFNSSTFSTTGTPGLYSVTLDTASSILNLLASETYTMTIESSKPGFTPYTTFASFSLQNISATVTPEANSSQIFWNENLTARVCYNDSLHGFAPITGARLRYQVASRPDLNGFLLEEGDGWYNFTVNSTAFTYADTYILTITASQDNFYTNFTTIEARIQKIKTYIGTWLNPNRQSITVQEVINFNVTTTLLMYFNYSTATGIGIPGASVAEYEWEDPVGNKFSGFLTDAGEGIYNLDFDTANKPLGKYSLVITIGQTNYVERVAVIALYIVEKPVIVTPVGFSQGDSVRHPQGEDITISVDLFDPVADAPLVGATVELFFDGEYRAMSPSTTLGRYEITLSTEEFNALFAQIDFPSKIRVTMVNYTQSGGEYLFTIAIAPPEWFGIPRIYWFIIIGTVAIVVVAFAIIKGVQYSRIPQFVRDLDKTGVNIRKNKSIGRENITENRGESISKALEQRFAAIGMSAAERFAPKEAVPKEGTKGERKPEEEVA